DAPFDAPTDAPDIDAAVDATVDAPTDATVDAPIDAPPPIDIAYLPASAETVGTGDLTIAANQTINTSNNSFPSLGSGVTFSIATPPGGGSDIVVLHVDDLTINSGATLRVIGTRPFAIVAGGNVNIIGSLDLSAEGNNTPGAGGSASSAGSGQHGVTGARRRRGWWGRARGRGRIDHGQRRHRGARRRRRPRRLLQHQLDGGRGRWLGRTDRSAVAVDLGERLRRRQRRRRR